MPSRACGDTYGHAIGAGHPCVCTRKGPHKADGTLPEAHGCSCGNWWPQKNRSRSHVSISSDGKTYGSWPVLMLHGTHVTFGTRMGRYGGVMADYEGKAYVEQPDSWWNDRGFIITDPPMPERVEPPAA